MTVYYLDFKNGNDSNDGTSFANRKKTISSWTAPGAGDEIRVAGQPSTLVDANAKIYNCIGDGIYSSNRSISFTFSTTTGETSCSHSNHGMQTGDLIRIWNNTSHSTEDERPNGVWAVTRVDTNNFKLQEYTAPATGTGSGYFRYIKSSQITLTNAVVKNVACYNQTGNWTASTNVTTELATSSGFWSTNTRIKSRNYSNKIAIGADFTTGKAAYFATGTLDLSGYQQISFWIGQDSGTRSQPSAPNVSLRLCTDTQGDTSVHTVPIYTGQDSYTNQRFWRIMRTDFESNLNSSIQSVALYVDSDSGAQTFYLDNIIASKASSANDSITLDSIVGLKTSTDWPNYYMINSVINEKIIKLEGRSDAYNSHPISYYNADQIHWAGAGITMYNTHSQTVPIYKINPLRLKEDMGIDPGNGSGTYNETYFNNNTSGVGTDASNKIIISGGWDASNSMATQYDGGYTAIDGINSTNRPISFQSVSNADISRFIGIRGYYGLIAQSCQYNNWDHMAGMGGYYALFFSSNNYIKNCYVWGSHSMDYACYLNSLNSYGYVGIRTAFGYGGSRAAYMNSITQGENQWDRLDMFSAYSRCIEFYNCTALNLNKLNAGRWPGGGPSPAAVNINRSTGSQIGIVSARDCYYLLQSEYGDTNVDYFYEEKSDTTKSTGGNSYTNTQYCLYSNQGGNIKIKQGGITTSLYYAYYAPIYLNNVVDNYSGSHNVQNNHAIYAKNYDGVSGQVLNKYQYGTVEKETSIRHTASGVSWKIDVSSSSASLATPIEWLLTKLIVNANAAVTAKIWVYRDGTGVNGGLRVKNGAIAGVTANVDGVITDTTVNSWVECSMTFTPTEAGAVDIYAMGYYVNNTSHNVYLDDFSASQA